jgi:hypothetical protein
MAVKTPPKFVIRFVEKASGMMSPDGCGARFKNCWCAGNLHKNGFFWRIYWWIVSL